MNILIIGGNRFFGKKLTQRLLENQNGSANKVTLLNRQNLDDGFGDQVARIKCDRKDFSALKNAIGNQSWDLVYDQVCYDASDARAACEIFAGRATHYVFTSSQSVYDFGGEWLKEESFDPYSYKFSTDADSKTQYAEAKRQCEAEFFKQKKFTVTAVRFTFVVGEDDYTERLKWHVDKVKTEQSIYFPKVVAKIPMIHSDDAAQVLYSLGVQKAAGPFNASSPQPIALHQLMESVEQVVGKKATFAQIKDDANSSPYGVLGDWYMSIDKLKSFDVTPRAIDSWLPSLLKLLSNT